MLFYSDNHYAEQLLRSLGQDRGTSNDGTGLRAESQFLSERGIPRPGLHLMDGSGLSDANRIASITLARLLADAQARGGNASMYMRYCRPAVSREPCAVTTLPRRWDGFAPRADISAASASLAGYVDTAHHGRLAFAFLINDSPGDPDAAIVRAIDRLALL